MQNFDNIVQALAGVAQAATLAKTLATKGTCDNHDLQVCVDSILKLDAESNLEVFGGLNNLTTGLNQLKAQLSLNNVNKDEDIARYMMNLMTLERQLSKNNELLDILKTRLQQARAKAQLHGNDDFGLFEICADMYKCSIATLSPRVKVNGSPNYLQQKPIQDKIRTVLLSGIRSAVLWRQSGGKRRQLIFQRRTYVETTVSLLDRVE